MFENLIDINRLREYNNKILEYIRNNSGSTDVDCIKSVRRDDANGEFIFTDNEGNTQTLSILDGVRVTDIGCTEAGIIVSLSNGTIKTVPIVLPPSDPQFITPAEVSSMFISEESIEVPMGDIMTEAQALSYLEEDS